jgi:hypothetical protein
MYQELVTVIIEKALFRIGTQVYNTTAQILKNEYQSVISDCYVHPEYLRQVLEKNFNGVYKDIVDSINKDLKDITNNQPIERFLSIINK